ncbi:MAG TPA: hypothetical protein VN496_17135, partial [Burkholderiales bacterium]|nr:hypothetical protein [Burkholderiales bacterium]
LTGLLGRPQMLSPMRRSILYFALARLLMLSPDLADFPLGCEVFPAKAAHYSQRKVEVKRSRSG